jgi:ribonuclease-3
MTAEIEKHYQNIWSEFEKKFALTFSNPHLLIQAFKHRSYLIVSEEDKTFSNERLEFLGDSVLNLVLTEFLFNIYPNLSEGDLSKMKSILVSKKVLGEIALEIGLGDMILMNKGEEQTGGRQRLSVLADAYEAILGALYLDQGFNAPKDFIKKHILDRHEQFTKRSMLRNHKSELLELLQAEALANPIYQLIKEVGPDHDKHFYVEVRIGDFILGFGQGKNKKQAEQNAAEEALEKISRKELIITDLTK